MDIRLFSLCKQEVPQIELGKKCILKCFRSFFPGCEGFMNFTSQKRMLLAAAQSLRAADIVVVAVQNNMYNSTKKLLAQALEFKLMKNNSVYNILRPLAESGKIKETMLNSNSTFPQGAGILPTDTMFNCGFVLSSGSQRIIYLPVEAPFAEEVVYGSLYDLLASIVDEPNAKIGLDARHRAIIKRTADKLDESSVRIAFSASPTTEKIESLCENISSKHCFVFEVSSEYNESASENIIDRARALREEQFVPYGVVFSEVMFDNEARRIIKVAIADEEGTNTFTFYGIENESDKDFIANCIDKIMLTLYNFEDLGNSRESPENTTVADKNLRKNLFFITAGMVGASAVIGLILSLIG